ncbi:GDSL-type esterase/lipase family protein [Roseburia intestinalis]|uniref:GDSL-type esterase/lipase family protein n=1 Tax=Roseburia intestinalis TaxID=166486 RepID=UPI001FADF98F|nr:GDSL-type esterase/lipase family protein [Roseburia intestinalis]
MISCLLIPLIYLYVTLNINAAKNTSLSVSSVSTAQKQDTTTPSDTSGTPSDNTDRQDIPDTEVPMTEMTTVDADYFDDALMIGDSRTVGLKEYGTLGNATFYCDSGLSIYELENKKIMVDGIGKVSISDLLASHTYHKIYLMLGINELGYDVTQTFEKYASFVNFLQTMQPDAIIYVEANLHVTAQRSDSDKTFNNANINAFNQKISTLADQRTIYYLDINELFDDANGNLGTQYSNDNAHPLGKYYAVWCDWLMEHAVVRDGKS